MLIFNFYSLKWWKYDCRVQFRAIHKTGKDRGSKLLLSMYAKFWWNF